MWQKCPICNGTGTISISGVVSFDPAIKCQVCCGKGIINELTGMPPQAAPISKNVNMFTAAINSLKASGDFRDDDRRETQQEYFGK